MRRGLLLRLRDHARVGRLLRRCAAALLGREVEKPGRFELL
jgi:hypothetical protein